MVLVCRFLLRLVYVIVRFELNNSVIIDFRNALLKQNPPLRPVLKHGPRSLSCMRVVWW